MIEGLLFCIHKHQGVVGQRGHLFPGVPDQELLCSRAQQQQTSSGCSQIGQPINVGVQQCCWQNTEFIMLILTLLCPPALKQTISTERNLTELLLVVPCVACVVGYSLSSAARFVRPPGRTHPDPAIQINNTTKT